VEVALPERTRVEEAAAARRPVDRDVEQLLALVLRELLDLGLELVALLADPEVVALAEVAEDAGERVLAAARVDLQGDQPHAAAGELLPTGAELVPVLVPDQDDLLLAVAEDAVPQPLAALLDGPHGVDLHAVGGELVHHRLERLRLHADDRRAPSRQR